MSDSVRYNYIRLTGAQHSLNLPVSGCSRESHEFQIVKLVIPKGKEQGVVDGLIDDHSSNPHFRPISDAEYDDLSRTRRSRTKIFFSYVGGLDDTLKVSSVVVPDDVSYDDMVSALHKLYVGRCLKVVDKTVLLSGRTTADS